ncbi:hypothetical protein [Streptomyces sp. NPDC004008]
MEDAAESLASSYVEVGDLLSIGDRNRQRVRRAAVAMPRVGMHQGPGDGHGRHIVGLLIRKE